MLEQFTIVTLTELDMWFGVRVPCESFKGYLSLLQVHLSKSVCKHIPCFIFCSKPHEINLAQLWLVNTFLAESFFFFQEMNVMFSTKLLVKHNNFLPLRTYLEPQEPWKAEKFSSILNTFILFNVWYLFSKLNSTGNC